MLPSTSLPMNDLIIAIALIGAGIQSLVLISFYLYKTREKPAKVPFGEPVRFSEVTFALMSEPGLADVRNLRLLRSPPRLGEVQQLGGRRFSALPVGENLNVGVSEIATFADDFALMRIV